MNQASLIQVGRRVRFFAGYGGIDGEGVIVAVHGEPNPEPAQSIFRDVGRVIRQNDCTVDVILFDGRSKLGVHQCGIDAPGIGIKLLDRVHRSEVIEMAKRNAAKYEADRILAEAKVKSDFEAAEAARVIAKAPLFYWNGIKDTKGEKLQPCFYSKSDLSSAPAGTISIYARNYASFSKLVRECFEVKNDTDVMTDYFDNDRIRVIPSHPLYAAVKAAAEAAEAHANRHSEKVAARRRSAA